MPACDNCRAVGETTGGVLRRGSDRIVAGVCSGLAAYFGVNLVLVRVIFIILTVAQGVGIILYLALWFLMDPAEGRPGSASRTIGDRVRAMNDELREDFRTGFWRSQESGTPHPDPAAQGGREKFGRWGPPYGNRPPGLWAGIILIVLGAYFLLTNLGVLSNIRWDLFWPAVLIVLGILLLVRRR
jgi:phage shock protein PspC (stress-responsive transcriptional regulator)